MCFCVLRQIRPHIEFHLAEFAIKRAFGVRFDMLLQVFERSEAAFAYITDEFFLQRRPITVTRQNVPSHMFNACEALVTVFTFVWFDGGMMVFVDACKNIQINICNRGVRSASSILTQVVGSTEAFIAYITNEGSLVGVRQFVALQMRDAREDLRTYVTLMWIGRD